MQAEFEKCLRDAGLAPQRAADFASFLMQFNEGIRVPCRRRIAKAISTSAPRHFGTGRSSSEHSCAAA